MGYIAHRAIVVTLPDYKGHAEKIHAKARKIFKHHWVSPLSPPAVNGYRSFLVGPDGSKEGWNVSKEADAERDAFIEWLYKYRYSDFSGPAEWVEVFFSPDDREARVQRHAWKKKGTPRGELEL